MERLSWRTVEYIHTDKTSDWYWIVGIITISIAVIAIILNNIIFAILVIVSSFTLSLFASRKPDVVPVVIDNLGVTFGKTHYPYLHLDSFWIETRDNLPRLLLKSKKLFMPYIVIHLEDEVGPNEIRAMLVNHLTEEEHTEPLMEKVLIYFGF